MVVSIKDALLIINGRKEEVSEACELSLAEAIVTLDKALGSAIIKSEKLSHYLERRSYQKALAYIEQHPEHGA